MKNSKKGFCLDDALLIGLGVFLIFIFVGLSVVLVFGITDFYNSPIVTKMRFDSGYTEMIQKDNSTVYITHPAKYEVQLDGENWVEVTEAEYAELKTGSRYRK